MLAMSWGTKRRNLIIIIIFIVIILPILFFLFSFFNSKQSCFDNKRNGNEIGVDCGGDCELLCENQVVKPVVLWTRYFEVGPGRYNVVSLIENQNPNARLDNFQYEFSLFNQDGIIIAQKEGNSNLKPKSIIPIFEAGLLTNNQTPVRMEFKFSQDLEWKRQDILPSEILILSKTNTGTKDFPSISTEIKNSTSKRINNIKLVAIVYDSSGNAIGSLSTFVEYLNPEEVRKIDLNWFNSFSSEISKIDIYPLYE